MITERKWYVFWIIYISGAVIGVAYGFYVADPTEIILGLIVPGYGLLNTAAELLRALI